MAAISRRSRETFHVLPDHGQGAARVQVDHVPCHGADVDHLPHPAGLSLHAQLGPVVLVEEADLLRPHGEVPTAPLGQVGDAHEAGHELRRRVLVDFDRGTDLLDAAVAEDGDAIAHRQRLFLVVGDVDEGDAHLLLDPLQLDLHLLAQLEVEGAQRLVEQEHAGAVHDGPGKRHPLTLPAGELARLALPEPGQPDHGQRLLHPPPPLLLRHALDLEPVLDVLAHGHVREERVVLEDGVHVAGVGGLAGDVHPAEQDPPRVGSLEPCDEP